MVWRRLHPGGFMKGCEGSQAQTQELPLGIPGPTGGCVHRLPKPRALILGLYVTHGHFENSLSKPSAGISPSPSLLSSWEICRDTVLGLFFNS